MLLRCTIAVVAILSLGAATPAGAEWGWYRGDIATFSPANTSASVPDQIHEAVKAGLDWVVLSAPAGSGTFVGLGEMVEEVKLTVPRLTPILGTGWHDAGVHLLILGIDSRAPLPETLPNLLTTVDTHKGVAVLTSAEDTENPELLNVSATMDGTWRDLVLPGGPWDRVLTAGNRVFITSTSLGTRPAQTHETTVWAEGNQPDQIIRALRNGSSYVAKTKGIQVDFQVDGKTFGQTVFHQGEPFIRIRATSPDPITSVSLIADGAEIWSTKPGLRIWEERFFLPAQNFGYVRLIASSEPAGITTVTNPVFLVTENAPEGELPLTDGRSAEPEDLTEIGGVIEPLSGLSPDVQTRVLREFLSDPSTRFGTSWLLQNRSDIISDGLLARIADEDTDDQARLGAAYALVTRGSELAPEALLAFLLDDSSSLQAYAGRMFAHFTEGFTEEDWPDIDRMTPEAKSYMIRAYHPGRFVIGQIDRILADLGSDHPGLSSSASDKLVTLATRHYKVIESLLDAADEGRTEAVEVLAIVADHRTISRLRQLYDRTIDPAIRRSTFLALAQMGAPYPDRPIVQLSRIVRPTIDGDITDEEWQDAIDLGGFRSDHNGADAIEPIRAQIGSTTDSLYLAVSVQLGRLPEATLSDEFADTDDRGEIVFAGPPYDEDGNGPRDTLTVNAYGKIDSSFDCEVTSRVTAGTWSVEMGLALGEIESYPRLNVAVVSPSTRTRYSWSVTYGSPSNADRYGELRTESSE